MAINVKDFNEALEQIETLKGISRETVLEALKEAMTKGFKKDIGDDDALVEVELDIERGIITMNQIKKVVEEVEDDLLEISVEDANANGGKYVAGDDYKIPASEEKFRKAIVMSIKSVLHQKFVEVERANLFDQFKDKIGTMITGKVESCDERGAMVSVGHTSIYLPRKEMIKDERFLIGESIKLYVNDVTGNGKGSRIVVSRSCEGFLKALLTDEIHDINDGTIVIKAVARDAGERSKVAVYSEDPNIDPAGSCIGPNGTRIQKVVTQLGNSSSKEKIDIITYSENVPLYIMEALKPAKVVGVKIDEEKKSALVVVKDESFSVAIGRKGVNARLAVKLTGYNIDIKTESDAIAAGLEYLTFEQISALELERKAELIAKKQRESLVYPNANSVLPGLPEGYVAPQARKYEEDVTSDLADALERVVDTEETSVNVAPAVEETPVAPVKEAEPVAEEVKTVVETPVEKPTEVKTTTTLEDLEKSLENSAKSAQKTSTNKSKKKQEVVEEEKVVKTEGPRMSIYTEEELKAMEEEEAAELEEDIDDDIDYDEYDDYYDEK